MKYLSILLSTINGSLIKKLQIQPIVLGGLTINTLLSIRSTHSTTNIPMAAMSTAPVIPTIREDIHAKIQNYKFPTIEERFKYYMGSWADRSDWICSKDRVDVPQDPSGISPLQWNKFPQLISINQLKSCTDNPKIKNPYCTDAHHVLSLSSDVTGNNIGLFVFNDINYKSDQPFVIKSRSAISLYEPSESIPIVWPLKLARHFGPVDKYKSQVKDAGKEIEWSLKKSTLFWRGGFTGSRGTMLANWLRNNSEKAQQMAVDIGFTEVGPKEKMIEIKRDYPWAVKGSTDIINMQEYKYLLSLEGNDVATGLKWMLYSNSVVFMPTPTRSSWAMEDKLVPFVHYVPIAQDLSNLLEMIEWAKQNDDIVQLISHKSTEYMERLYVSDQAALDQQELSVKLSEAYTSQFKNSLSNCLGPL